MHIYKEEEGGYLFLVALRRFGAEAGKTEGGGFISNFTNLFCKDLVPTRGSNTLGDEGHVDNRSSSSKPA